MVGEPPPGGASINESAESCRYLSHASMQPAHVRQPPVSLYRRVSRRHECCREGIATLALLRQHSPETVPIVLTGYASLDTAVGALRRGAYDYLTKPCDTEELKATVARAVERRRLGLQLAHHLRELEAANTTIRAQNAGL